MPPTAPNTAPNPKDNPALGEEPEPIFGPPEEEFWERYNKRMEFPLATVATVFLHVVVGALLIYVLVGLMDSGEDRSNPKLQLMQVGGHDDTGEGSEGAASDSDLARQEKALFDDVNVTPTEIPNPKDASTSLTDPGINLADPKRTPAASGGPKGDGKTGTGPGGTGADSTRARGLRWVLRFRVTSGKDYIDQLKVMGAEVLIPLPPDDKKRILIRDLKNPTQTIATPADEGRLARKIQFSDNRRQMVREVLETLDVRVPNPPNAFYAFFPKELEEELAHKEKGYRGRRPEAIEETIFRITIRGGSYEVVVDEQTIKK